MTVEREANGQLKPGSVINPDGKGGFRDHPELRSDGRWSKRRSDTYLFKLFGGMTPEELEKYQKEHGSLTFEERRAINRTLESAQTMAANPNALKATQFIIERLEGKPRQQIEQTIEQREPPVFNIEFRQIEGENADNDIENE